MIAYVLYLLFLATVIIADPTANIPPIPHDFLELDEYLENKTFVFDNLEGGPYPIWRQGWQVQYKDTWTEDNPLNVFLLMHSHNDPGWIKTFEAYFQDQTRRILDNVVNTLAGDSTKRFIWAEISFLSRWWEVTSVDMREKAKKVIKNGQLEIVTGGWVMNDEATVHYLATINQLTMGHIWLEQNIGVVPKTGWAIDPFGHSPTMPSLLNQAGFDAAIINRVHYYLKKVLSYHKFMEFRWQQQWDTEEKNNELLVHMFPFFSYDIPHTCGPEPKICSQYDFTRVGSRTPWGDSIDAINQGNLETKAEQAVDQYKKKSTLYKSGNNVLIPLGEDFKYDHGIEQMAANFDLLIEHINSNKAKYKVQIQWGTLADYFASVAKSAAKQIKSTIENSDKLFPSLKGDFFVYDDTNDDYWSGYYTSRPYWKNLDRQMEASMRSAEIVLAWARGIYPTDIVSLFDEEGHCGKMIQARKLWSIFQHHDGMTGTAAKHVVEDYGVMLHTALSNAKKVMQSLVPILLSKPDKYATLVLDANEEQNKPNQVATIKVLDTKGVDEITVVVYNSLARPRKEIMLIHVNSPNIEIKTADNKQVKFQISPIINLDLSVETSKFRVYFEISLPPVTVSTLFIHSTSSIKDSAIPTVTALRVSSAPKEFLDKKIVTKNDSPLKISSDAIDLTFDAASGMMNHISFKKAKYGSFDLQEDYVVYRSGGGGAYLFKPTGKATSITSDSHPVIVIQGPLVSEVIVKLPETVSRTARLYNIDGDDLQYIEIENNVNLQNADTEIVNRFTVPSVKNENTFFTDLNGFSFRERFIHAERPIQSNFYPITETAFIQDSKLRFSVNTQQPLGVGALSGSVLELVLDRRTTTDDNRGLNQPVDDNLPMVVKFQLTFEDTPSVPSNIDARAFSRSLKGLDRALRFNNPVTVLSTPTTQAEWLSTQRTERSLLAPNSPLFSLPDVHLTTFKMRDTSDKGKEGETIVQIIRYLHDVTDEEKMSAFPFDTTKLESQFREISIPKISRRSLTTIIEDKTENEDIDFQRISTWVVHMEPNPNAPIIPNQVDSSSLSSPSSSSSSTSSKSQPPKSPTKPSSSSSSSSSSLSLVSPGNSKTAVPESTGHPECSEHHYYRFSIFVFIASCVIVVYTTSRRTAVRWIALALLITNFVHVLIATYLLDDLHLY